DRLGASKKKVIEKKDSIGDVDLAVIVGVGRLPARWRKASAEEKTEDEKRVRDAEAAITVGVAAMEENALAFVGNGVSVAIAAQREGRLIEEDRHIVKTAVCRGQVWSAIPIEVLG